jgi:hypothetical protein
VRHWIHLASCAHENIDKSKNESKEGLLIQQSGLLMCVCLCDTFVT